MLFGNTPWPAKTEKKLIQAMKNYPDVQIHPHVVCSDSYFFLTRTLQQDFYQRISKE